MDDDERFSGDQVEEFKQAIRDEMVKDVPRMGKVKKMMKKTFVARRKWVVEETRPVSVVMKRYPPFRNASTASLIITNSHLKQNAEVTFFH